MKHVDNKNEPWSHEPVRCGTACPNAERRFFGLLPGRHCFHSVGHIYFWYRHPGCNDEAFVHDRPYKKCCNCNGLQLNYSSYD